MHANDNLSLLATIRHHPEDDDARLIYADWLDDQGDETRAEFIRLQVADPVELSPRFLFDPKHPCEFPFVKGGAELAGAARQRQIQLYRKYVRKWNGAIHRRLRGTPLQGQIDSRRGLVCGWSYRRGFPCTLWATADAIASHPEAVFSLGPIERLSIVGSLRTKAVALLLGRLEDRLLRVVEFTQANLPSDCRTLLTTGRTFPGMDRFEWIIEGAHHQSTR